MIDQVAAIGRGTISAIAHLGRATLFLMLVVRAIPFVIVRYELLVRQIWHVGVLSLLIILVSGIFVGMVLGLQGYNTLVDFGATDSLGVAVAKALTRELGPVVSALLFAGRAGSALAAEIGLMRATEQLDGMEMMAVDPVSRVVAPRFLAGVVSLPLLTAIFTAVGVLGGYVVGVALLGVDAGSFWSQMQAAVEFRADIVNGVVIKSTVFAVVVTWIAVFEGFHADPTSEGVSAATTRTVVVSSLAVLSLDFLLTALMFD